MTPTTTSRRRPAARAAAARAAALAVCAAAVLTLAGCNGSAGGSGASGATTPAPAATDTAPGKTGGTGTSGATGGTGGATAAKPAAKTSAATTAPAGSGGTATSGTGTGSGSGSGAGGGSGTGCDHKMPISPDEFAVYRYTPEGGTLSLIVKLGNWGCAPADSDGAPFVTVGKEIPMPMDQAAYVTATNPIVESSENQHIGVQEFLDWLEAHPDSGLVFKYHVGGDGAIDRLDEVFTP